MYALLSDLPKAREQPTTVTVDLGELLQKVNVWDSQHAMFLGSDATNVCYAFRATLRHAVLAFGNESPAITNELLDAAARLELALRSDLGIHGIDIIGTDLAPRDRDQY
jgi:hypothetical protein